MGRFTLPRDLYHGTGALETLKTLPGKKAIVVVGGGSVKRYGFPGQGGGLLERSRHGSGSCLKALSRILL